MNIRKKYIAFLLLLSCSNLTIGQSLNFYSLSDLEEVKIGYLSDGKYEKEIEDLKTMADEAIARSPFTITKYTAPEVGGRRSNDYYSDSPYWWPDPADPNASFIRKDGERYPGIFLDHKTELRQFCNGLYAIIFYSYFSNDSEYSKIANDLLRTWFIDESTKMNSNLKYSQLIRNRDRRRGVGIIDGRRLSFLIDAIILLDKNDKLNVEIKNGVTKWYSEFHTWLTESYYGLDEKQRGNNHGTWWAVQVAAISNFTNNADYINEIKNYSREYLIDNQFDENARQPKEEERTRSLSYTVFNIKAHSYLGSILYNYNIDNFNYVNKNNVSLIDAIDFVIPFVHSPDSWNLEQIRKIDNVDPMFLGLAGMRLNRNDYLKLYINYSSYDEDELDELLFDPIQIIFDAIIKNKLRENE